jgi:magnesium chelatase family protein
MGIDSVDIAVEVNTNDGGELRFVIVGLPDASIRESYDRVFSALKNSGYAIPRARTTVNLAPSYIRKEGSFYDLPIALGLIQSTGQSHLRGLNDFIIAGELGLSGKIRAIKGGLALAIRAKKKGKKLLLPVESADEASMVDGVEVFAVRSLGEAVRFLSGEVVLQPLEHRNFLLETETEQDCQDFSEIRGQFALRRAMEVAVAGGHNILMIGPPGVGKSMVAKCIPGIMSVPTFDEFLETMSIYSAAGLLIGANRARFRRPFRAPHHTISSAGLLGGGGAPNPGEISLSHNGVLFLDELPEFRRDILEALRQPLEDGEITISRSSGKTRFPSNAMVVAAMNPCPCGHLWDKGRRCKCSKIEVQRYRSRISGPMIDRFDIHVCVHAVPIDCIQSNVPAESSAEIKSRIDVATQIQVERLKNSKNKRNSRMSHGEIMKFCEIDAETAKLLKMAVAQLSLSARAYDKVLKVSRTIADLGRSEKIVQNHMLEALQYRPFDVN